MDIYNKYINNILGVIIDVCFFCVDKGEKDGMVGIKLCVEVRKKDLFVFLIIQLFEMENVVYVVKYGVMFIDKNFKKMDVDFCWIVFDNFGFGDFVFCNFEMGVEIVCVWNLKEL